MTAPTIFHNMVTNLQSQFIAGYNQKIASEAQNVRIAAVVGAVIAAVTGAFLTSFALSTASASFGFSIVLLAPAAFLFLVSFESYKVLRGADIIAERAETSMVGEVFTATLDGASTLISGYPSWALRVKKEIDDTIMLSYFFNLQKG